MTKKRILILGGGLAGLSAAWHLQKKGEDCVVFEKESQIGGMSRTKAINGFTLDCCGHLLHFKHRYVFSLINRLLGNNLSKHKRRAWVYSCGRYIRYPFQANLYSLPSLVVKECLLGAIQAFKNNRCQKLDGYNFLQWIHLTFGKGIARHFMIPYNTKFWTLPPQELTCEWLDGFIPTPSLKQIIEGAVKKNRRQFGYSAEFWYPRKGGINQISLALARQIKNINTQSKVVEIDLKRKRIRLSCGNKERFDYLVSTLPLPEMRFVIKSLPADVVSLIKKLRWNSVYNLNLGIKKRMYHDKHWIYFPQKNICFFRVGFFHNFSSHLVPAGTGSLYAEVSYSSHQKINKTNITFRIIEDLKKVGILRATEDIDCQDTNDIKYAYPIYDHHYKHARNGILAHFMKNNLMACGRFGSWRYLSMEEAILDGRRTSLLF